MVFQRYSLEEAVDRIYRLFRGATPPSDAPESLSGDLLSVDESVSALAELLAGSLPGEDAELPVDISITGSTPIDDEYGEIYTTTGTVQGMASGTWTKIAQFAYDGLSSSNIALDSDNNKITVNDTGHYFCGFQVSFESGFSNSERKYEWRAYWNSTGQDQIKASVESLASGTIHSCSALGLINVTTSAKDVEVYVRMSESGTVVVQDGQLYMEKKF